MADPSTSHFQTPDPPGLVSTNRVRSYTLMSCEIAVRGVNRWPSIGTAVPASDHIRSVFRSLESLDVPSATFVPQNRTNQTNKFYLSICYVGAQGGVEPVNRLHFPKVADSTRCQKWQKWL
jgi:hypothetical protein